MLRNELLLSRVTKVEAVENDLKVPLLSRRKFALLDSLLLSLYLSSHLLLFFLALAGFYLFALFLTFIFQLGLILDRICFLTATLARHQINVWVAGFTVLLGYAAS